MLSLYEERRRQLQQDRQTDSREILHVSPDTDIPGVSLHQVPSGCGTSRKVGFSNVGTVAKIPWKRYFPPLLFHCFDASTPSPGLCPEYRLQNRLSWFDRSIHRNTRAQELRRPRGMRCYAVSRWIQHPVDARGRCGLTVHR